MTSDRTEQADTTDGDLFKPRSDAFFYTGLGLLCGFYIFMILAMLIFDSYHTFFGEKDYEATAESIDGQDQHQDRTPILAALADENIQYSIKLSLISCTLTTILALWVSVPIGYVMSRSNFWGKALVDAVLDIPIVLPPLVIGISLLIIFRYAPFAWISDWVVFEIPAVIFAQFMVACAFAVRTMRTTFDQIPQRQERVALTLGCSQGDAFWRVVLPQARRGMIAAGTLAWARSLGEFGPILMFAGSSRLKTEVLPTSVFLEIESGNLQAALAVSLIMIVMAMVVLIIARSFGLRRGFY